MNGKRTSNLDTDMTKALFMTTTAFLFSLQSFSSPKTQETQEEITGEEEKRKEIWKKIYRLKDLDDKNQSENIIELTGEIDRYLVSRKKKCLNGKRKDRDRCLDPLISMHKAYIDISFDKRAAFLKKAHGNRMEHLERQRQKALKDFPLKKGRR
ncbi:MAG: hypothetical protein OXB88_05380 [Bacteriovoracales bacterium]|nr:hypothetical protein [Bacteriovoracales bacterium]